VGANLAVSLLTTTTSTVKAGSAITATATIKNSGASTAGASTTAIYLSKDTTLQAWDTPLATRPVSVLEPLKTDVGGISVTIPVRLAPGTYYLIATADVTAAVPESSEADNTKYKAITVTAP
jgi:subtilase family serine protease